MYWERIGSVTGAWQRRKYVSETDSSYRDTRVWKITKYRVFFCPYFLVFGLNTGIYGVNLLIQSDRYRSEKMHLDVFSAVRIWKMKQFGSEFFSSISVVNFKQVNADWVLYCYCKNILQKYGSMGINGPIVTYLNPLVPDVH